TASVRPGSQWAWLVTSRTENRKSPHRAGLRRSRVMSGSSVATGAECDAEGGQGSVWVAGVAAQRGGDVDRSGAAEDADDQVAEGRHDAGAAAGAQLRGVLAEGGVADVMQRLDRPVSPDEVGQPGGAGQLEGEAGDGVHGLGRALPGMVGKAAALAGDLDDLGGVGEAEVADRDGLEGAQLDAA